MVIGIEKQICVSDKFLVEKSTNVKSNFSQVSNKIFEIFQFVYITISLNHVETDVFVSNTSCIHHNFFFFFSNHTTSITSGGGKK